MEPSTPTQPISPTAAPATSPAPAAAALPGIPDTWPGATGLYKYSKQAVKVNLGTIGLLWLIDVAIGGGFNIILRGSGGLFSLICGSLLTAALILTYFAGIKGQRLDIGEAFSQALPLWLNMIGVTLLVGISVVISFVLLIIPFFFVLPRLVLAQYFLVDKNVGVMDAYKASWDRTKGHTGKIWGVILLAVGMAILMVTIIGIPFSIYFLLMYSAALAILYKFLDKAAPAVTAVPVAPTAPPTAAAPVQ